MTDQNARPDAQHPLSRGERTAWLLPTAVLGGLGALLLVGGAGAATAVALSVEEQRVTATVTEPVDSIVVDGRSAVVEVVTADVADLRVEAVHAGFRLGDAPQPRVRDGELTVEAAAADDWLPGPDSGMRIRITVPADDEPVDLRLSSDAGMLSAQGRFGDVDLGTEAGVVQFGGGARTVSATSEIGTVVVSGAQVDEALDVHTEVGATDVRLTGEAPERTSITTSSGAIEAALPEAAYWVPQVPAGTADPGAPASAGMCADAPADRPCLYVSADLGAADVSYVGAPSAPLRGPSAPATAPTADDLGRDA